jgi:hypothetical protein
LFTIEEHVFASRVRSDELKGAIENSVSVVLGSGPVTPAACVVVAQARSPVADVPGFAAEFEQVFGLRTLGRVASNFTTNDAGRVPVRVVLVRSRYAESESRPSGLIRQLQHAAMVPSGSKT